MKSSSTSLLGLCLLSALLTPAQATFNAGSDNFADATVIDTQNDTSSATNLMVATKETNEPGHHPGLYDGAAKTVWWKWTAPENGFCSVDTISPSWLINSVKDTILSVYTGSAFPLTRVASNDNLSIEHFLPNAFQSRATFYATAGVTYSIAVDGAYDGAVTNTEQITALRLRQVPAKAVTRRAAWLMRSELSGSGMISMTTTASGSYSATFQVGATRYAFKGTFDRDGTTVRSIVPAVNRGAPPAVPITLRIDGAGAGQYALETDTFTTGGAFPRQKVFSTAAPNPLTGVYNLGGNFAQQDYHERGWAQTTVKASGAVTFAGTGPDGAKFTVGGFIHEIAGFTDEFYIPAYAPLHKNKGFVYLPCRAVQNTNVFNDPEISFDGWYQRPTAPTQAFYNGGYLNTFALKGKRYLRPALNTRVMGFLEGPNAGSGILRIRGSSGEMADPIDEFLTVSTANRFVFATPLPRKLSMTVNPLTGLVTGSITTTDTILGVSKARARRMQGLIFREGSNTWLRGHVTGTTKNLFMEVVYNYGP